MISCAGVSCFITRTFILVFFYFYILKFSDKSPKLSENGIQNQLHEILSVSSVYDVQQFAAHRAKCAACISCNAAFKSGTGDYAATT